MRPEAGSCRERSGSARTVRATQLSRVTSRHERAYCAGVAVASSASARRYSPREIGSEYRLQCGTGSDAPTSTTDEAGRRTPLSRRRPMIRLRVWLRLLAKKALAASDPLTFWIDGLT